MAAGVLKRTSARVLRSLHGRTVGLHPSVVACRTDDTDCLPHGTVEMRVLTPHFQPFGPSAGLFRLLCPLLTSALRSDRLTTTSVSNPGQQRRSPEVRPTAFTARPPDLPPRPLMTVDFAITCSLVRPGRPRYPVLVHRAAALLHASFRRNLAIPPLRFANPSPPSGWIEDFHLQAVDHARHTEKAPPWAGLECSNSVGIVNPTGAKASHQNVLITAGIPAFTSVRVCGRELLLLLFLAVSRFVHPGTSGRNRAPILARSLGRCAHSPSFIHASSTV